MAVGLIKFGKIYKEDMTLATAPNPATVNVEVMNVGTVPMTPCDMVVYSSFGSYASDGAAATGGVLVGEIYWSTATSKLKVRMT